MKMTRQIGFVVAVVALLATPTSAELYRCTGSDGKPVFTDQKGTCPHADPIEPSGVVHSVPTPSTHPPAALRHSRQLAEQAEQAAQSAWQQKKRDAQARIDQIRQRRERMKPYVAHCNRGGYVTTRDEAGIQEVVNCSQLRRDFATLDELEVEARHYLDHGLPEECRRAGCLPGWLR